MLKDFPVLGPGSVEAAYIAGAARNQFKGDQFWQFHAKLLGGQHGPVGKAQALQVAKDMGANMDQIAKDAASAEVKSTIQGTMRSGRCARPHRHADLRGRQGGGGRGRRL